MSPFCMPAVRLKGTANWLHDLVVFTNGRNYHCSWGSVATEMIKVNSQIVTLVLGQAMGEPQIIDQMTHGVTDVTGRTDRGTRQTCKRGQEQDLGGAGLDWDWTRRYFRLAKYQTGQEQEQGQERLTDCMILKYKRLRKERKIH